MIAAENLNKQMGTGAAAARILNGVTFNVPTGEFFTLLGPSGCGKTTSLRCIAGLETPDAGAIAIGQRTVFSSDKRVNLRPDQRRIGMVFQSYAIWPHMTVAQNVAYPLGGSGVDKREIGSRAAEALDLVGLGGLGERPATDLSGGQQQRVALARAIVSRPEVLLLDEPLSNLDAKLREQMRTELTHLQKRLGHTVLYVTHDQEEALALSDRVALMRDGVIVEENAPDKLFEDPESPFTAEFVGVSNFVAGTLAGSPRPGGRGEIDTPFGRFSAKVKRGETSLPLLFFRPHHASFGSAKRGELDVGFGTVTDATYLGDKVSLVVSAGDKSVRLNAHPSARIAVGAETTFSINPDYSIIFLPQAAA